MLTNDTRHAIATRVDIVIRLGGEWPALRVIILGTLRTTETVFHRDLYSRPEIVGSAGDARTHPCSQWHDRSHGCGSERSKVAVYDPRRKISD
jgi:hypothetical protein